MKVTLIFSFLLHINLTTCTDLNSFEINRFEFTPIHDAIILNDIVYIMREFENTMKSQFNNHLLSGSESEEDIENLLLEYQQYLDKAHEQTLNYIRKNYEKTKIPLLRNEKLSKIKPVPRNAYIENNNVFADTKHHKNSVQSASSIKKVTNFSKLIPDIQSKQLKTTSTSCICKENVIPYNGYCKQCVLSDSTISRNIYTINTYINAQVHQSKISDNNTNLRIGIDIQLQNISITNNLLTNRNKDRSEKNDDIIPKDTLSTINMPFSYLNFPIPIEFIGYKQNVFNDNSYALNKNIIHKKKKLRLGNNNKKHKNKKLLTFHSYNIEPRLQKNTAVGHFNNSSINKINLLQIESQSEVSPKVNQIQTTLNYTSNNTSVITPNSNIINQTSEKIDLAIDIINKTKENDITSENTYKKRNSIETDSFIESDNVSTTETLRLKREIINKLYKSHALNNENKATSKFYSTKNVTKNFVTEFDFDTELLHWPLANKCQSLINSKNITALILDTEIKKAKLIITKESIRFNHKTALEKAIFGDVDWNDVDVIVPIFMSFIGKYITGVLTFCSQNVCHSMKCAKKICMHRICIPANRHNKIGHCAGNNNTDSVATMESILDLPSNIAFEIVDILEEKMLGKLFGKGTLCISSKCSAFAAYKKTFEKSKCTPKELNLAGHCPNLKNIKLL